jgi:branched-chain amino acid transport system substrate-binding protein
MVTFLARFLSLASVVTLVAACAVSSDRTRPVARPGIVDDEQPSPEAARPMPWEVWAPFKTLSGQPLTNKSLIYGDELRAEGLNKSALEAYLKAERSALSADESEAGALRLAGQYLLLNNSNKALSVIGRYHRKRGLKEDAVGPEFGLLLAYGFGGDGEANQSLAWFSRVHSQGGNTTGAARRGAELLLMSLPNEKFEAIALKWHQDEFVNGLIGRERARRAQVGFIDPDPKSKLPFWASYDPAASAISETTISSAVGDEVKVGVILSLAARYGSIGPDMQRGIQLASDAQTTPPKIKLEIRDVGSDTAASSAAIRELVAGPKVAVVMGPLGVPAATTAREVGVPLLSLSKTEPFTVGDGVFRLGMTTTSQVDALVNAAYGEHKITRYAVVYPQTGNGTEFLEVFRSKLGSLNLQLALEVGYSTSDETSMLEAAQRLEGSSAEAVLIPDTIEVATRILSNLSPEARKRIRALGTSTWDSADKIAHSQAIFDRAIFVAPFFKNSTRPEVQEFIASYRGKFNATPSLQSALGFDAATLLANALKRSREKGVPLTEAIGQLPQYDGISGIIAPQPGSGEIYRALYVVEVGPTMFQEKMPPQNVQRYDDTITMRGNDVLGVDDGVSPLEAGQNISSGY